MDATSSSRWPRSPSHGKCSKRFCGSSRNYGRNHHPRQHEAFDCHAFKRNRQEECVQMPVKIARSAPRPSFGLPELLVAIHTSRQSCCKAGKARIFTPVRESSGESRSISWRIKKMKLLGLVCTFLFLLGSPVVAATITYFVNEPLTIDLGFGTGAVTGTITTDGTIGPLTPGSIPSF